MDTTHDACAAKPIWLPPGHRVGDMCARQTTGPRPARSSVASDRLRNSELVARRGMLLIVVAALLLAGAMVLATTIASS